MNVFIMVIPSNWTLNLWCLLSRREQIKSAKEYLIIFD